MLHRGHELAVCHLVAGELVSDDHPGHVPQALEQSAEELLCGHRVSARLDQNVEHGAVLVDRAPQVPLFAVDLDEHLIQVPFVARPRTTTAQLVRILLPEPLAPSPDRLIGHVETTFEHQLLHVAEAQREPVVQPDAMADDLGWKPEPFIGRACSGHDRRSCPTSPSRLTNLTMPVRALAAAGAVFSLHHAAKASTMCSTTGRFRSIPRWPTLAGSVPGRVRHRSRGAAAAGLRIAG